MLEYKMSRYSPRGFTIIELLICIAIIGILSALLFPVFMVARRSGQRTVCLNNLRQIGAAFQLYADEHDDQFPNTGDLYLWNGRQWRPVLDAYISNRKSYWCPADGNARQKYDSTSYAYMQTFYHRDDDIVSQSMDTTTLRNAHTCGRTPETRTLSEVRYPSNKILVYEWTTNHETPLRTMWDATGAHTALFADSHVAYIRHEQIQLSVLGDHDPNWTVGGLAGRDVE